MSHSRLLISAVLLVACSSSSEGDDDDDMVPAGDVDARPAAVVDAAPGQPDAAGGGGGGASLWGTVTRSIAPVNGGKGPLFVAVFDKSPLSGMAGAPIAQVLVPDADLSGDATIDYRIDGIPPREAAYHIIAFLDDNHTVDASDPAAAGPDKGDLLSMNGIMAPTVVLAAEGDTQLDLDLNFAMPFDP